jgi:hypothetical protein
VQDLSFENAPFLSENGLKIRLYSGSFAGLTSPVQNYVPLIVADIQLQPGITTIQQLSSSYNAFLYVIEGSIQVDEDSKPLKEHQVGWLDKSSGNAQTDLVLTAGEAGGRVILYAGQPQNDPIVSYGPFIADHQEEIKDLYRDFRQGKMGHVSALPAAQRFIY